MTLIADTVAKPMLVTTDYQRIYGTDADKYYGKTVVVPYEGPAIVICPPTGGLFTYPSVTADGLLLTDDFTQFADLRDAPAWDIDGLATLSIEFFFKPTAVVNAARWLLTSSGREFCVSSVAATSAFGISANNGNVTFSVTTSNGTYSTSTTGGLLTAASHHIACVYNGSLVKIFIDGTLAASTAATGTIVQKNWEWVQLGCLATDYLQGFTVGGLPGRISQLRLSDAVIRTADFNSSVFVALNFTTTDRFFAELTSTDADTGLWGPLFFYTSRTSPVFSAGFGGWIMMRVKNPSDPVALTSRTEIVDINFSGGSTSKTLLMAQMGNVIIMKRVRCDAARYGVHLFNNCYSSVVEDCEFNGGTYGRMGIANTYQTSVQRFNRLQIATFKYALALGGLGGRSVSVTSSYILASYVPIWSFDTRAELVLHGTKFATEGSSTATYIFVISNLEEFAWNGGDCFISTAATAVFRLKNVRLGAQIANVRFRLTNPATLLFDTGSDKIGLMQCAIGALPIDQP